jgi:hypothetical protein
MAGMRRAGLRVLTSLVVLAGGLLLAGCSPRQITVTAVYLDDGEPTAIFQPCDDTNVAGVSVTEATPEPTTTPSPSPSPVRTGLGGGFATPSPAPASWKVTGPQADPIRRIRLLRETPPGWQQQNNGPGLAAFQENQAYQVAAELAEWKDVRDAGVEFTLADLRALGEGEVWAMRTLSGDPEAMTRREFRRYAGRTC